MVMTASTGGFRFTENRGQFIGTDGQPKPEVLFRGQAGGADIYLTRTGMSFVLVSLDRQEQAFSDIEGEAAEKARMANAVQVLERMDMQLVGMNPNFTVVTGEARPDRDNYYLGHCPDGILDVPSFHDITYKNVLPGIDWHFSTASGALKTEFIVSPGADASAIRFEFSGTSDLRILPDGSFEMVGTTGHISDSKPTATQGTSPVDADFQLVGSELQFLLGNYDPQRTLVIDPWTRVYSTFFGGSGSEWYLGHVTTTDLSGNVYLGGHTASTNFPSTAGVFQVANAGSQDGFVAKFDNNGARLWGTYYGGSSSEGGIAFKAGLCVDPSGNVWFATVTSSTNFPVTAGCFQATNAGSPDAGLVKLSTAGARLYATYYGGSGTESPSISRWGANSAPAIATDASGNIFMTGLTSSTNLPVTAGCFQAANAGGTDSYLVKWSNAGARLYATYYGGSSNEESAAVGIAVDGGGNAWMTGCTASSNFPVTAGCFQSAFAGMYDQYLVKWSNACARLYATYYGGSNDEGILCDVDVTNTGDIWMGVYVQSNNFPVTPGCNQPTSGGGWEFGLVRFNNAGTRQYASYFGSSDQEEPWDISVDKINGNVCLTGSTWGATLPVTGSPFQGSSAGSQEGAIVVISPAGVPSYVTYYGSTGHDEAFCSVFDINQALWVSGMAATSTFPVTAGAFQTVNAGSTDPFLAKFVPPVILDGSVLSLAAALEGDNAVRLNWHHDQPGEVAEYHLERDLGGAWVDIHTQVPTSGMDYHYLDAVPMQGLVQYRVRVVMKDGSQSYSEMARIMVPLTEEKIIAVWPSPARAGEEVHLMWQSSEDMEMNLTVTTIDGKVVLQREEEAHLGRNRMEFETEDWAPGLYVLSVKTAKGSGSFKLNLQ